MGLRKAAAYPVPAAAAGTIPNRTTSSDWSVLGSGQEAKTKFLAEKLPPVMPGKDEGQRGLRDHREAVRKIVARIAGLASAKRATALDQLLILAGLRQMEEVVEQEVRHMPLYDSILDNKVFGAGVRRGANWRCSGG